ncbi:MAG: lytic murein transglycosylase [Pseudomonadota bacterium]
MQWRSGTIVGLVMALLAIPAAVSAQQSDGFPRWLETFRARALSEGISPAVVDDALGDVALDDSVVVLDQKQPETKITFSKYISNTISPRRIRIGRAMLQEHHAVLQKISRRYGVQPKYIVALWAIESDYGNNKGGFSVVQSLATLAYEGRRAAFFGDELIAALKILEAENLRADELTGSWAGAMGDCQFMPSTYLRYAVDGNGDGKRDIWNEPADVFASVAHYLNALGWNKKEGWGRAVSVPEGITIEQADLKQPHPASYWRARGFTYEGGAAVPDTQATRYAMLPGTAEEGAYLVTDNFQALLQWNRSRYFATSVGMLADAIGE